MRRRHCAVLRTQVSSIDPAATTGWAAVEGECQVNGVQVNVFILMFNHFHQETVYKNNGYVKFILKNRAETYQTYSGQYGCVTNQCLGQW